MRPKFGGASNGGAAAALCQRCSGEYRDCWGVWRGLPDSHGHEEAQRGLCLDRGALARPEILVGVCFRVGCSLPETEATFYSAIRCTKSIRRCTKARRTWSYELGIKGRSVFTVIARRSWTAFRLFAGFDGDDDLGRYRANRKCEMMCTGKAGKLV